MVYTQKEKEIKKRSLFVLFRPNKKPFYKVARLHYHPFVCLSMDEGPEKVTKQQITDKMSNIIKVNKRCAPRDSFNCIRRLHILSFFSVIHSQSVR
jgi:hypothetical protein